MFPNSRVVFYLTIYASSHFAPAENSLALIYHLCATLYRSPLLNRYLVIQAYNKIAHLDLQVHGLSHLLHLLTHLFGKQNSNQLLDSDKESIPAKLIKPNFGICCVIVEEFLMSRATTFVCGQLCRCRDCVDVGYVAFSGLVSVSLVMSRAAIVRLPLALLAGAVLLIAGSVIQASQKRW